MFNIPNNEDKESSILYSKVFNVIPVSIDLIIGKDSEAMNLVKEFIEQSSNVTEPK